MKSGGFLHTAATDIGLLLIRTMPGIVFLFHGSQKLFGVFDGPGIAGFAQALEKMGIPYPLVNAWLAALAEFVGGLALLSGLWMRVLILPTIGVMAVAATVAHGHAFALQHGGMEYALTLGVVMAGLVFTGPGSITLGNLLRLLALRRTNPAKS